jgi:TonB-linked SusC/RagA family outer membrane protein
MNYKYSDNTLRAIILIVVLISLSASSLLAQRTITGKITDAQTGDPLPGVNIVVQGTTRGTISDANGNYTIQVQPDDEALLFSFVGYQDQTVSIGDQQTINVALQQEAEALEEVVVVGYGTIQKSDLTGSVSSVEGENLTEVSSANTLDALSGKLAGAQISSSSGEPGANPVVRVRGVGTINNANPIYVVDGVIVEDISFLSPSDIQSVELLKDASATAIYGSRGANGVFMISTKSGGEESRINFTTETGIQQLRNKIELLNGPEFARALNDITPGSINNPQAVNNIDWQDRIFEETPVVQNYNLSVSGGTQDLSYYFSGGIHSTEGIIPKSNYDRYNVKLNTEYQARDFLNIGTKVSGAYIEDQLAPNVVGTAYRAWPIDAPYDEQGDFAEVRGNGNPLAAIEYTNNKTESYRLVSNMFAELTFLENFKFKTSYQLNYQNSRNRNFTPQYKVSPTQQNQRSSLSKSFTEDMSWIFENTLTYDNSFGDHEVKVLGGYTAQENNYQSPGVSVYNLIRDDPKFWYLNAATNDTLFDFGSSEFTTSMVSYLFRTNYNYKGKYLLTATFRADGSSKFSEGNRWGYFPSFALGWNISKEPFFPQSEFIDNLKIRSSWGVIGNEKIGWADRFALIGNAGSVFGVDEALQAGATYQGAGNRDIRWESTEQLNLGIELQALDNRLTSEVELYRKTTKDILVNLSVPGYYGIGSFQKVRFNGAEVLNQGLEFNARWREKVGEFNYSVNVTASTVDNEVLSIQANAPVDSVIYGGTLSNGDQVTATFVGQSIGSFYGYETAGVFQNEQELNNNPNLPGQDVGDLMYKDQNGDNEITQADKTVIGSPIPDLTYGFGFTVGYKGLTLRANFQGQLGNEVYNAKNQTRFGVYNFEQRVTSRWTGPNSSNTEPALDGQAGNYEPSEYFLHDGSFLRLRNLSISYSLPNSMLEPINLNQATIYLRGNNLFSLTEYPGYSPDIGGGPLSAGIDSGIYPITRSYSIGINVSF